MELSLLKHAFVDKPSPCAHSAPSTAFSAPALAMPALAKAGDASRGESPPAASPAPHSPRLVPIAREARQRPSRRRDIPGAAQPQKAASERLRPGKSPLEGDKMFGRHHRPVTC